ncbi:MAG: hypothetical protein U1F43_31575 [Myxococcota bacterium]
MAAYARTGSRALALALAALSGCASTPPRMPRSAAYLAAVRERVATHADETRFVLRHNPSSCDCPPFEVKLGEVWQRTELVGVDDDDATVLALEAAIETGPDAELAIEGHIEGEPATCGRGALYVSLVPTAFIGPPAQPAPNGPTQ